MLGGDAATDPNAPGSVQGTGEVGDWRGGKFTAHGEKREVKRCHSEYAAAKKKAENAKKKAAKEG